MISKKKDGYYIIYLNILGKYKDDFRLWKKSDLIMAINQSNYIQRLQKNGLLPIIKDLTSMVLHIMSVDQKTNFSIACKTSDTLSDIKKIICDKNPQLKQENFFFFVMERFQI